MPFMEREGIPWFVWHIAFKGHLAAYHERMHKHSEALLAGVPPAAEDKSMLFELSVTLIVLLASVRALRLKKGASFRLLG